MHIINAKLIDQFSKEYRPLVYKLDKNIDNLEKLLLSLNESAIQIYDTIDFQIAELIKINTPQKVFTEQEIKKEVEKVYEGVQSSEEIGVWVYYPWAKKLVHLLDEEGFIKVRTNRNIYKITPEELLALRKKKIGVIGLSVGQSIAMTIATERVCGEIRLADFDSIELSNMNRLSNTNVYDLGMSKAVTTARKIAELDPFINVICWKEGITKENIDTFLGDRAHQLDILVEECDSFDIKILSRIKARQKRIPVVMDTNDNGMIDIERFDLEPQRPILHGRVKDLEEIEPEKLVHKLKLLTREEKMYYLSQIIDIGHVSEEMKFSLSQIGKTITGWPQLSSAVTLGGAMVTDTCRRIALGKFSTSGRYFINFDDLIH